MMIESFGFPEFMFLLRSFGWTLALTACAMLLGSLMLAEAGANAVLYPLVLGLSLIHI